MNKIHLTIHFPGGAIDPMDVFWVLFKHDVHRVEEEYQDFEVITARDAWRIAKAFGYAAQHRFRRAARQAPVLPRAVTQRLLHGLARRHVGGTVR
ncbi:MAG TPA: hypothetical protein VGN93_04475 [Shinella sp.]|uniref:hypothetical protein n=1 Tax=Shinella sp. TaxID=1870904 RepID=UPI002E123F93|nr:hypothetical protein [Shinella sp.]